jgi:gamma-carbonic anhydrase
VLVGMNATVLDGSVVGDGCIIAAGSVVSPGKTIPPRSLVAGVPGKVIKTLTEDDEAHIRQLAGKYGRLLFNYLNA